MLVCQMTGFFNPAALGSTERLIVREAMSNAINKILVRDERCCSKVEDVTITIVCNTDGTGCVSLALQSRPKDCGDGECSACRIVFALACLRPCLIEPLLQARGSIQRSATMVTRWTAMGALARAK
jgi:hypothetical protein